MEWEEPTFLMAHREHIYQLVLRRGASHATVAALYTGVVGFCAAGAILMLTLSSTMMWIVPAIISAVFLFIGLRVFAAAKAIGLIEESKDA